MSALEKTVVLARVASSSLPKRKALGELGVPKSIYYRWLRRKVSRAATRCTAGVSKFRENVRLSVQQECHSVKPQWYQMMTLRNPRGIVALADPQRPCIS